MEKIAVLLSSYNGEKYIYQQIDSILNQKDVEIEVFIRDDGSSNQTINVLKQILNDKIHLILDKNIGIGNSFMQLVYHVNNDFDYYAFSDQDDIWLEDKLIRAIKCLKSYKEPILYCSNQTIIDENKKVIGTRFKSKPDLCYEQILSVNHATGCTMVWNKYLQDILINKRPSETLLNKRIHDVWVAMVASISGKIIYDENSYILYRQHKNNAQGAKDWNLMDDWKLKLKKISNPKLRNGRSQLAREIVSLFPNETTDKMSIKLAANCNTIKGKIDLINHSYLFLKHSKETKIGFVLKILFNLF